MLGLLPSALPFTEPEWQYLGLTLATGDHQTGDLFPWIQTLTWNELDCIPQHINGRVCTVTSLQV